MKRILVTGATGNLGRAVVAALRNKGLTVRAAGRDTKKLDALGGETAILDYENHSTLPAARQDVEALFQQEQGNSLARSHGGFLSSPRSADLA